MAGARMGELRVTWDLDCPRGTTSFPILTMEWFDDRWVSKLTKVGLREAWSNSYHQVWPQSSLLGGNNQS